MHKKVSSFFLHQHNKKINDSNTILMLYVKDIQRGINVIIQSISNSTRELHTIKCSSLVVPVEYIYTFYSSKNKFQNVLALNQCKESKLMSEASVITKTSCNMVVTSAKCSYIRFT